MIPPNFIAKCSLVSLSALCADVVFPMGKQPGGMIAAPTRSVPPNYRRKNFVALLSSSRLPFLDIPAGILYNSTMLSLRSAFGQAAWGKTE